MIKSHLILNAVAPAYHKHISISKTERMNGYLESITNIWYIHRDRTAAFYHQRGFSALVIASEWCGEVNRYEPNHTTVRQQSRYI